jgi:2-methylisocitrate lyase-like PEP mutase family enzyme
MSLTQSLLGRSIDETHMELVVNSATPDPGSTFLQLHHAGRGFVMPNAWDAGSAIVLAAEGFLALGTTSAGIAFSLGRPDSALSDPRCSVSRTQALDRLRQIVGCVPVPVNADLESGYGSSPEEVAETVRLAIAAGAAGANIEDVDRATGALYELPLAVERIVAAHEAARACGRAFVLNARTDAILLHGISALDLAVTRANRLAEAGAQCVFTPGVADVERAATLVRHIAAPLNLVVGLNEAGSSASALIEAGVARVSVGGSIARAALGVVRAAAQELRARGTVSYAAGQIPQSVLNRLFEDALNRRRAPD